MRSKRKSIVNILPKYKDKDLGEWPLPTLVCNGECDTDPIAIIDKKRNTIYNRNVDGSTGKDSREERQNTINEWQLS